MSEEKEDWEDFRRYEIKRMVCTECEIYPKQGEEDTNIEEWCFYFEADCRGDAIALCEKHLAEALERLRKEKGKELI